MNILIINHFPLEGSGSGVYVKNIAINLVKNGHKVCIIMPENTTKFSKLNGVKIHSVYFKREEVIKGQLDFNFPCMDSHPRSNFLFNNMTELQIEQYKKAFKCAIETEIEDFKPDIIHSQHIWIISSIATQYKIPVLITCHGSDIMGYNESTKFHNYAKNAAKCCKKIIAISNKNEKDIKRIYKEDKCKVITMPNGYDTNVFYREKCKRSDILKEFNINREYDKIVCFAGRLAKNKGVDILLKSAKIYEAPNVLTIIAGDGQEHVPLVSLKEKLGLKNVEFVGNQDHNTLRKIYSISDVCAVPSREEAFGLVALEAIACGIPVIATKQGGIPDFVTKDVGILVEPENVEELADNIEKVLYGKIKFDTEYLEKYAKNNYSEEKLMNKLMEIYKEILR